MRVDLFGVGTKSTSKAITAQSRKNCMVEVRQEQDRSKFVLVGRFGLTSFITTLGSIASRGMWAVNTLSQPLLFTVNGGTLYSINNAGVVSAIGSIQTATGDVSLADDGTFLVLVDGVNGWVYNMLTPAGLNKITDGNFTTTPRTVTWQDNYFIVTSTTKQWQLSQITPSVDPTVWPAVQIGFAGSGSGALQNGIAYHGTLNLLADYYGEFWQDAGSPQMPYQLIPNSATQYGLAAPFSLQTFDNTIVGLFQSKEGGLNIARLSGFQLKKISDHDIDQILTTYSSVSDAKGLSFNFAGHPMYVINLPTVGASWMYDGFSNIWSKLTSGSGRFWGTKFANFQGRLCVSDFNNGNIYQLDANNFTDNGTMIPMEVVSKHIWNDDKYIGVRQLQIDIEGGAGLVTGQGENPVCDLHVSKDGGNSYFPVGYSSMGEIGEFTQRLKWNNLGAARDWVLKLIITDPIKRIVTGASADIIGGAF